MFSLEPMLFHKCKYFLMYGKKSKSPYAGNCLVKSHSRISYFQIYRKLALASGDFQQTYN